MWREGAVQGVDRYLSACTARREDREPHRLCPELVCGRCRAARSTDILPCTSAARRVRHSCSSSSTWMGEGGWVWHWL
jgi:hypothetical protein